jgi:hypothetical protein
MIEYEQIISVYDKYFNESPVLMLDIGANMGRVAGKIVERYPSIEVHAFEPYPEIFQMLNDRNSSFNCYQLALSDFNGVAEFYLRPILDEDRDKDQVTGDSSLLYRPEYGYFNDEIIQVKVSTAKDFLLSHGLGDTIIDIVKIDVEGAGMQVVNGFADQIKNVKLIHIELENLSVWDGQALTDDVIKNLNLLGFALINTIDDGLQTNAVFVNRLFMVN